MANRSEGQEGQHSESLLERAKSVIPETGGSIGGALLGLAVGGPAGAVAGAAATPVATAVIRIAREALLSRTSRAEQVLLAAADENRQSVDEFTSRIINEPEQLSFAAFILAEASETLISAKIQAFSRLLASGINDATKPLLTEYTLIAKAIAMMDEPHIIVLSSIANSQISDGLSPDELAATVGASAENLRPYVRMLELYGLITDTSWRSSSSQMSITWTVTDLGRACLDFLSP